MVEKDVEMFLEACELKGTEAVFFSEKMAGQIRKWIKYKDRYRKSMAHAKGRITTENGNAGVSCYRNIVRWIFRLEKIAFVLFLLVK